MIHKRRSQVVSGWSSTTGRRTPRVERLESRELLSVTPHMEVADEHEAHGERLPFYVPPQMHVQGPQGTLLTGPSAGTPRSTTRPTRARGSTRGW